MGIAGPRTYDDVVAAHAPALLRLAVMLTGHVADAEDLVQSTFARTVRHGERIAAMAAPAAYLRQALINEHRSRGRRAARRVRTVPIEETPEPSVVAVVPDARDEVWRWLAMLKPQQRAVLALRYYEDLPDTEIARVLGCSESTVRSHAHRGLAALRAHLDSIGSEEP